MRLIDADTLLQRAIPHGWSTPKWVSDIMIDDAPTIDAVPVVRCKDCFYGKKYSEAFPRKRYCKNHHGCNDLEWFCGDGKRRDDETN